MNNNDVEHLEWIYGRMVNLLGENANYDYMLEFNSIIRKAKESIIIGDQSVKDNNWIDLDTKEVPTDYFYNDRYLVEKTSIYCEPCWLECTTEPSDRWKQIKLANEGQIKYRYRIQENKEPMRITKEKWDLICDNNLCFICEHSNKIWDNRKVIIID